MTMYRKKPVENEAIQYDGTPESAVGIVVWINSHGQQARVEDDNRIAARVVVILTPEGIVMTAHPGDWIIKGVKGEFYPCPSSAFKLTYDELPFVDHGSRIIDVPPVVIHYDSVEEAMARGNIDRSDGNWTF